MKLKITAAADLLAGCAAQMAAMEFRAVAKDGSIAELDGFVAHVVKSVAQWVSPRLLLPKGKKRCEWLAAALDKAAALVENGNDYAHLGDKARALAGTYLAQARSVTIDPPDGVV